jgi:23S rRNA pseudouridine1911/1915/1917 synthase
MKGFEVIFEDDDLIVINKSCGVAVQSKEDDIVKYFSNEKKLIIHPLTRLDQSVSGLALFAKNAKSAASFTILLNNGKISKQYIAIVEGHVVENEGRLEHKLLKIGQKAVVSDKGKNCVLIFKKTASLDRYTKLNIELETGRFHQIRAQLSAAGYPIKGDVKYNSRRSNKEGGIYLHCQMLAIHYKSGVVSLFESDPPKDKTLYWLNK